MTDKHIGEYTAKDIKAMERDICDIALRVDRLPGLRVVTKIDQSGHCQCRYCDYDDHFCVDLESGPYLTADDILGMSLTFLLLVLAAVGFVTLLGWIFT